MLILFASVKLLGNRLNKLIIKAKAQIHRCSPVCYAYAKLSKRVPIQVARLIVSFWQFSADRPSSKTIFWDTFVPDNVTEKYVKISSAISWLCI